jgi:hypothetical protein
MTSQISTVLQWSAQLDALLTKIVDARPDRDTATLDAVTKLGEQLCELSGVDLMQAVQDLVCFDLDHFIDEERSAILELCWDGIGDNHESYVVSTAAFSF